MGKIVARLNTKILFFGIILLSIILRFYLLGANPPSLTWDEASIGYNAYSILHTAKDEYGTFLPLSFRSFDDYKPPVYVYLTVPTVFVFGLTEFAVRFPAAVFGVLSVIVVYFLTRELLYSWDKKRREVISLTAAFFLCISPWHLQFSRAAFEGNVGMFFLITSLLFFFKAFKKPFFYFLFSIFFIFSIYSYHSFRLINPIIFIVLLILFYKELLKEKLMVIISIAVIVFLSLPIYTSFINSQGASSRLSMVTIFSDTALLKFSNEKILLAKKQHDVFSQIIYDRRVIFIPQMVKGYFDHFRFDFLFLKGDGGVQHHAYNMGMLYLWDFPFIIFGLFLLIKKLDRKILLLFIVFLLGPLPASLTSGTPQPIRAIAMIPPFQIFSAVGFISLCFLLLKKKILGKSVIVILVLLLGINIGYYLYSYYVTTPIKYGYFWQYGNKQAILYAKANENKYNKIVMSYQYDQPYIYYLFYNKVNPSWYQKNWNYTKTGEVYRFYRKIGKYEFYNINYERDKEFKKTLLIGTPQEIPDTNTLSEINFPDESIAYKIVATK